MEAGELGMDAQREVPPVAGILQGVAPAGDIHVVHPPREAHRHLIGKRRRVAPVAHTQVDAGQPGTSQIRDVVFACGKGHGEGLVQVRQGDGVRLQLGQDRAAGVVGIGGDDRLAHGLAQADGAVARKHQARGQLLVEVSGGVVRRPHPNPLRHIIRHAEGFAASLECVVRDALEVADDPLIHPSVAFPVESRDDLVRGIHGVLEVPRVRGLVGVDHARHLHVEERRVVQRFDRNRPGVFHVEQFVGKVAPRCKSKDGAGGNRHC